MNASKPPAARLLIAALGMGLGACTPPQGSAPPSGSAELGDCAIAGASAFAPDCPVERAAGTLTIRHPDGGFRRLLAGEGDNRIRPADGAQAAQWRELADGRVEVVIGPDRYRFHLEPEVANGSPASPSAVPGQ